MFPRLLFLALLLIVAAAAPGARAQDAESFADWQAECANAVCVASTVTPGGVVSLRVLKENAADASWEIAFAGVQEDVKKGSAIEVSVDDARPLRFTPDGYATGGGQLALTEREPAAALFEALVRGNQATLVFTHTSDVAIRLNFSLAGLGAATEWIEERQASETTASEPPPAPGERPDEPPAPPEGETESARAPETENKAPDRSEDEAAPEAEATPRPEPAEVPELVSERHLEDGVCRDYETGHFRPARIADNLDDHHKVYVLPCYAGAYNVAYRVWITDSREPDEVERALFAAYSDEQGWTGTDQIVNADYDPATKTLTAVDKGRGLGDCGSAPTWRWHAESWRLMEYRYQGECDGASKPEDWPVVFEHPEN